MKLQGVTIAIFHKTFSARMLYFVVFLHLSELRLGRVWVIWESFCCPFWFILGPKPCCKQLLGCRGYLWGDRLLNYGPSREFRNRLAHIARSILESFLSIFLTWRLPGAGVFSHSRLDVLLLQILVSNTVARCVNSEVVDVLEV